MAYHVRVSDDVVDDFAKACKNLGFKQNGLIEQYMKHIIKRSDQINSLKDVDFVVGVPIELFFEGERVQSITNIEPKSD